MSLPTMKFRNLILATMAFSFAAFSQTTDFPYQVRYASNLNSADSVINITNDGATGAGSGSGFAATVTGSLCANFYVFAADEEFVSCCSCPVTPTGLVSLSVQKDLISNPLGRVAFTAVTIEMVATLPVGGSCNGSAAVVPTATLVPGAQLWLRSLPFNNGTTSSGGTETQFAPSTLSQGMLNRLGNICTFAVAQGTGTGICNSCELNGLGAASSNQ